MTFRQRARPQSLTTRLGFGLLACFLLLCLFEFYSLANRFRAGFPLEDDALFLPKADALKTMSLGHHELASDLVFLRAMVYFGSQLVGAHNYKWLDNYLDTIVTLDPLFKTPYRWAGVVTMYNGKVITNETVLLSNHFLKKGIERFPKDWELAFMLGCNYLFELKSKNPAQTIEWNKKGATYIERAALLGGGPDWLPLLTATLFRREGNKEAAIRHLEEVYLSTSNPTTKEEVRVRLVGLRTKIDFAKAEEEQVELTKKKLRLLRYSPDDFFIFASREPLPRQDWPSLLPDAIGSSHSESADALDNPVPSP